MFENNVHMYIYIAPGWKKTIFFQFGHLQQFYFSIKLLCNSFPPPNTYVAEFSIAIKKAMVNPWSLLIHFITIAFPTLNAKFQDRRTLGS